MKKWVDEKYGGVDQNLVVVGGVKFNVVDVEGRSMAREDTGGQCCLGWVGRTCLLETGGRLGRFVAL